MKAVFLDIDGCLNHILWYKSKKPIENSISFDEDLDPTCIERINNLCLETDSKVVISSDWRISSCYKERLERAGLKNIIGHTPITVFNIFKGGKSLCRGEEIKMWLSDHPEITNYVIIDDRTDFLKEQLDHFIQVDPYYGLTDKDIDKAKNILNNDN